MPKVVCPWNLITDFVTDAFVGYGIPRDEAEMCTDVLLESDKRGIESHGCNRFKPIYLDRIKAGIQSPTTNFEILKETETTAVVDGHNGMGQVIGTKAMQMAIDKAKKYGMGMVVVRNSCHYGIAGYYTSMATEQGCIGMTGTNARPSVAPTLGTEGMFGTNPFTLGVPSDEAFDFNFDCATSITQNGKIEYYARIGEPVHPGTIINITMQELTSPFTRVLSSILTVLPLKATQAKLLRKSAAARLLLQPSAVSARLSADTRATALLCSLNSFHQFFRTVNTVKLLTVRTRKAISDLTTLATSSSLLIRTTSSARKSAARRRAILSVKSALQEKLPVRKEFISQAKRNTKSGRKESLTVFRLTNPYRAKSTL